MLKPGKQPLPEIDHDHAKTLISAENYKSIAEAVVLKGQYWPEEFTGKDGSKIYAARIEGTANPRFFKTELARRAATKDLYSRKELNAKVNATATTHKDSLTQDGLYVNDEYTIDTLKVPVIVHTKGKDGARGTYYNTFADKAARTTFLASEEGKIYKEAGTVFADAHQYKEEYVKKNITPFHYDAVQDELKGLKDDSRSVYKTFNIPIIASAMFVYSLVYVKKEQKLLGFLADTNIPTAIHFDSQKAREDFIAKLAAGYQSLNNFEAIYGVPRGMQGPTGILNDNHLDELLVQPGDAFLFEYGQKQFAYVMRDKAGGVAHYIYNDEAARKKSVTESKDPVIVDRTAYVKGYDQKALGGDIGKIVVDKYLDLILVESKECWLEEKAKIGGKEVDLIRYRDNGNIKAYIAEVGKGQTVIDGYKLVDAKKPFNESKEYPQALGEKLANTSNWTMKVMDESADTLLNNEYVTFSAAKTKSTDYPEMSIIVLKKNDKIEYRFFKTPAARNECRDNSKCGNGYVRNRDAEWFVTHMGKVIMDKETKPSFMAVKHDADKKVHLITYSAAGKVESRYIKSDDLGSEIAKLVGYTEIKQDKKDEWAANKTYEASEIEFLKTEVFADNLKVKLEQSEYAQFKQSLYVCVVARHKDEKGNAKRDSYFFKKGDPAIQELITNGALKGYNVS